MMRGVMGQQIKIVARLNWGAYMHSTMPIYYAAQNIILNFLLSFEENNVHIITNYI